MAQGADFDTTYNIEYQVDSSLVVSVKEDIAVINQNPGAVPSSFIETITNISIYDIQVLDSKGKEIQSEINILEGQKETVITIPIKEPAIGKDKRTQIVLSYKTKDLATKTGRILNLHIPRAPVSNFMQEYNVAVKIPKDFGPQISITPKPVQEKMEEEGYILIYNKQALETYGISASFGDYQIFNFALNYNLKNESFLSKTMTVAIPLPVKNYQEIDITGIEPLPIKLKRDGDGNILAVYKVGGKKSLDVGVAGRAKVYTTKMQATNENSTDNTPSGLLKYTQPQQFWDSNNPEIRQLSQSLYNKEDSYDKNALEIYTYIVKNIKYDFDGAKDGIVSQRKGALQTLKDKKGLCLDFTDLYIALARSVGIPAREVDGYAYSKNLITTPVLQDIGDSDFLHSWVQYYSPQNGWISIDPTWGATSGLDFFSKLDNNHLAFVIKGINSTHPQPAGNFNITFSNDDYFNNNGTYDLENLQNPSIEFIKPWMALSFAVVLGLCTIFVLSKAVSGHR
jgi:hypothetical protein